MCKCGAESRPGQRYCRACHAQYTREWRKTHRLTGIARIKSNIRSIARVYLKRGKLIKNSCEICGTQESIEMHHDDYSNPLSVRWLCNKHHIEYHNNLRKQLKLHRRSKDDTFQLAIPCKGDDTIG
jgi:hypothetical protein